jgi:hypothetical protein
MSFGRERTPPDRLENTQILVNYRNSEIIHDQAGAQGAVRAGDRAPDAAGLRRAHIGFPLRLFNLLKGTQHVLVSYVAGVRRAEDAATLEALASDLDRDYGGLVRVVAIAEANADLPEPIGCTLLRDAEQTFARAYGATPGMTLLVRPDGYVGLLAPAPEFRAIQSYLQRTFG